MGYQLPDIYTEEPMFQYMYEVHITPPSSIDGSVFTIRTKNVQIPDDVSEEVEIAYKRDKAYWAGRDASAKSIDIVFWDDYNSNVMIRLGQWRNLTKTKKKADYIGEITIIQFDNEENEVARYEISNAWPSNLNPVQLDYSVSDPVEITCSFKYDEIKRYGLAGEVPYEY